MNNISKLKPEKVFEFFRQISEIPHGSGNTGQIAQYCLDFAAERNLKAVKDDGGNVIIYGEATEGYENSEPIIIQGHMDMVCEKTADCTKDMSKDGLTLCTDGEYLWAEGTTLGGDDGIALAYIFALLDSDDIPHPPIEAVITRDEETGMYGAEDFCAELVRGKKILNIDSEEEGILTVSCAGGITGHCEFPLEQPENKAEFSYEITVSHLTGGHSGVDIGKGRANAFKVLTEILQLISSELSFCISDISGGGKMNVIPQMASAIIGTDIECSEKLEQIISSYKFGFAEKYADTEPTAEFTVSVQNDNLKFYDEIATKKIMSILDKAPNGVQAMSKSMPDMVQTSLNMGVFNIEKEKLSIDFLIRSNLADEKASVMDKVSSFAEEFNGVATFDGDYPAWEYREESPLRELMSDIFRDMYGKEPVISAIHAGLECGIFSKKIQNADIISFGPDIENIHTPSERLNIASAERTWEYLKEILKRSK